VSKFKCTLEGRTYEFSDLKSLLACASPRRSGDEGAGLAATSERERVAARWALADVPLTTFLDDLLIPYEIDEITRLIVDSHDVEAFSPVRHLTVGGLREWLLSETTDSEALTRVAAGLTPEMVAAVSKIMRNQELISVAAKRHVISAFRTTLGRPGRLASRLQPNHPTDSPQGVLAAVIDGLRLGIGDAVIGVNPATDSVDTCVVLLQLLNELRDRFSIPTQSCVLSHVTTTLAAIERGAPVDLVFQSIAGSEKANAAFGVDIKLLREAQAAALSLDRGTQGTDVMYFETGQGSALSSNAHHGVDQQTIEARAYAIPRQLKTLLVNTVVGFIGPEYLADSRQIIRAGLEDHFCGKLLGVPMGVDVCYTNHADADSDDMDVLMTLLAVAGVNFLIAVPGTDDVMLGYQSLSFHDVFSLRQMLGLRAAPEFEEWWSKLGAGNGDGAALVDALAAASALSPLLPVLA
jgi:ethanolamine ammonia-lyase large subunit